MCATYRTGGSCSDDAVHCGSASRQVTANVRGALRALKVTASGACSTLTASTTMGCARRTVRAPLVPPKAKQSPGTGTPLAVMATSGEATWSRRDMGMPSTRAPAGRSARKCSHHCCAALRHGVVRPANAAVGVVPRQDVGDQVAHCVRVAAGLLQAVEARLHSLQAIAQLGALGIDASAESLHRASLVAAPRLSCLQVVQGEAGVVRHFGGTRPGARRPAGAAQAPRACPAAALGGARRVIVAAAAADSRWYSLERPASRGGRAARTAAAVRWHAHARRQKASVAARTMPARLAHARRRPAAAVVVSVALALTGRCRLGWTALRRRRSLTRPRRPQRRREPACHAFASAAAWASPAASPQEQGGLLPGAAPAACVRPPSCACACVCVCRPDRRRLKWAGWRADWPRRDRAAPHWLVASRAAA